MFWHNAFHYGLIVIGIWVAICLVAAVCTRKTETASASMLPILIFFLLIAAMMHKTQPAARNANTSNWWGIAIIAAPIIAALAYWHTAIWAFITSLF